MTHYFLKPGETARWYDGECIVTPPDARPFSLGRNAITYYFVPDKSQTVPVLALVCT